MKRILTFAMITFIFIIGLTSCTSCVSDAYVASENLSTAADQFEVFRRVVFYNGITDQYILMVEGYCSIEVDGSDNQLELTVKLENGSYMKHFLGLSDNVTYFVEQIASEKVSTRQYRVLFKPSTIIPNIDIK